MNPRGKAVLLITLLIGLGVAMIGKIYQHLQKSPVDLSKSLLLYLNGNWLDTSANVVGLRSGVCAKGLPDWDKQWLLAELPRFLTVYNTRPVNDNKGGTQMMHQFAMWCIVRHVKPNHVIESGINIGLGTWMLRQAAPEAQLILLDPANHEGRQDFAYVDKNSDTLYYTGKNFRDFQTLSSWTDVQLNTAETVVFFDDHQTHFKRVPQAQQFGIKHMIFDDNYWKGDWGCLSLKQGCACRLGEVECRSGSVKYQDDFGRITRNLTVDDIMLITKTFDDILVYYEFPMIWNITGYTVKQGSTNYLYGAKRDGKMLLTSLGLSYFPQEGRLGDYWNIAYVKLP